MPEEGWKSGIKVLHVAPEIAPFMKVGGLADVVSSLPRAQRELGIDARILVPAFPGLLEKAETDGYRITRVRRDIHVSINWRVYTAKLWKIRYGHVPIYAMDNRDIFDNPDIYPEELDSRTFLPFCLLSLGAYGIAGALAWTPHIMHLHDWATALVPIAGKWHPFYGKEGPSYRTVFTIHNIAHQGIIKDNRILDGLGMSDSFRTERLEFYGSVNLMKGAIVASDAVTTVSPTYAEEIAEEPFGMGLEGVIRKEEHKISGILNGLDTSYWNPSEDCLLPYRYGLEDMSGKAKCRALLLKEAGIENGEGPLMVMVTRLYPQKGIELVVEAAEYIIEKGMNLFILGSGASDLEHVLSKKAALRRGKMTFVRGYDEKLAHLAYAGGDIFLMPSLFEPCGLSQLIALRYGTVPVVRDTGGLADTVKDADADRGGYGFTFSEFSPHSMLSAIGRAAAAFKDRERWKRLVVRGMEKDFSWNSSAPEYGSIYSRALNI